MTDYNIIISLFGIVLVSGKIRKSVSWILGLPYNQIQFDLLLLFFKIDFSSFFSIKCDPFFDEFVCLYAFDFSDCSFLPFFLIIAGTTQQKLNNFPVFLISISKILFLDTFFFS